VARAELEVEGADGTVKTATADSSGNYHVADLANGSYVVRLRLPLGFDTAAQSRPWQFTAGVVTVPDVRVNRGLTRLDLHATAVHTTETVTQDGRTDTLATAGGAVVAISPLLGGAGLRVILSDTVPASGGGPSVHLQVLPSGAPSVHGAHSSGLVVSLSIWFVKTGIATAATLGQFSAAGFDALGPLTLWSDATATTFVDPRTGSLQTVPLTTLQVSASQPLDVLVRYAIANTGCNDSYRRLRASDGNDAPDGRIPLILVHGWQFLKTDCDDFDAQWRDVKSDPFNELLQDIDQDAVLSARYKVYLFRYPTTDPVPAASEFLWKQLPALGAMKPVLVGHSMGGLVARSLLATHGADAASGVITLGTPHEGAPVADLLSSPVGGFITAVSPCVSSALIGAAVWLYPRTFGVQDLSPSGTFISSIETSIPPTGKVFSFGGQLGASTAWTDPFLARLACLTAQISGQPSDGVVPVPSATPTWSSLQTVMSGYDHLAMATGGYFPKIKAALEVLSDCPQPRPRPSTNDFPISGAIARANLRDVDITLNPIVIGGVPASGLTAGNFTVIENGCVRPFSITTGSGAVGVDIVFVQDLSGSMGNSITAVRNSVLAFAQDLTARGLDVRIGSVGYSGPGIIPTSPASSSCEFLGPVQDLTDATTFQGHVQSSWVLGNGCDNPENGLEAIEYAHNNMSWRAGAARVYIDITDVSHHYSGTNCNGAGPCTDEDLASIVTLVGSTSTIHVVAPASLFVRTFDGGLDPYTLATATGGKTVDLGSGVFDLTALGITDVIGQTVRLTFASASDAVAIHDLRVRVDAAGQVAELAPGLVPYVRAHPSLRRAPVAAPAPRLRRR